MRELPLLINVAVALILAFFGGVIAGRASLPTIASNHCWIHSGGDCHRVLHARLCWEHSYCVAAHLWAMDRRRRRPTRLFHSTLKNWPLNCTTLFIRKVDFLWRVSVAFPGYRYACKSSIAGYNSRRYVSIFINANGALWRRSVDRCNRRRSTLNARPNSHEGSAVVVLLTPCDPGRLAQRIGSGAAGYCSFGAARRSSIHLR